MSFTSFRLLFCNRCPTRHLVTQNHLRMNDLNLPETPREINRSKLAMFTNQREVILSKDSITDIENDWLKWSEARCAELEAIV